MNDAQEAIQVAEWHEMQQNPRAAAEAAAGTMAAMAAAEVPVGVQRRRDEARDAVLYARLQDLRNERMRRERASPSHHQQLINAAGRIVGAAATAVGQLPGRIAASFPGRELTPQEVSRDQIIDANEQRLRREYTPEQYAMAEHNYPVTHYGIQVDPLERLNQMGAFLQAHRDRLGEH